MITKRSFHVWTVEELFATNSMRGLSMNNKFNNFQEIFQTETVDGMDPPYNIVTSDAILEENLFLI